MQEYVIELSKYFIALFMVLYTGSCFYTFRYPVGEYSKGIFILQNILMFLVQVLCFLDLSLTGGDLQYLFFFAFILIFLFATITMVSLIYENINRLLLNNMCMLLGIGLCMVSRLSFDKAIRQYVIVLVSLIMSLFIPCVLGRIHFFKKITWLYATLGIGLLSTVLILGEVTHGSKISFTMGGITFQPSEFVKILFLFFLAGALWENVSFQRVLLTAVIAGAHVVVLVVSKDLGSALIFFVAFLCIAFLRTGDLPSIAMMVAAAAFGCGIILRFKPYIADRFAAWRHAWDYAQDIGYQQTRTMSAMASGGLFGVGPKDGWLKYVGAANTDLVFGVVGEEFGFLLSLCCVAALVIPIVFTLRCAAAARSSFYTILSCATAAMLVCQMALNVLGAVDLLPLTGVTFPFVSMGGSSMISCWGLMAYLKAADTRQNASFALRLSKLAPQQQEKKAAPAPKARPKAPQEGFFADRPDIPVDKIFGKEEDK